MEKPIYLDIDKKLDLYLLGDTHFPRGKKGKFKGVLDEIKRRKYAKMIGLGDWVEAIKYGDPRYDPEEIAQKIKDAGGEINMINRQWDQFQEMIEPLAKENKILGLHDGNHEYQFTKRHSYNGLKSVCERLGIRYLGYLPAVWIMQYCGNETQIMTLHGVGGGKSEGYEVKQLDRHSRIFDNIELIAEGHSHKLTVSATSDRLNIDGDELKQNIQWRSACGSFLGNYDLGKSSYSQRKVYKPLPIGYVKAEIRDGQINNVKPVPI